MRTLQLKETQAVGGALDANTGLDLIAGLGAVAAVLDAPLAAAFAAGVYLGGKIVEAAA